MEMVPIRNILVSNVCRINSIYSGLNYFYFFMETGHITVPCSINTKM